MPAGFAADLPPPALSGTGTDALTRQRDAVNAAIRQAVADHEAALEKLKNVPAG